MVQKQTDEVVMACKAMLQRPDLTNEQQAYYTDMMNEATASTLRVDEESRSFQREQLAHSHGFSKQLMKYCAVAVAVGIGGAAIYRHQYKYR